MTLVDPLALLVHKIAPQQFDIAQGFTYISIRDQMNRASMVVDALVDSKHVRAGDAEPIAVSYTPDPAQSLEVQLVIFGAGAAGLSAARAAKKRNLSFVLVERGDSIPGGVLASHAQRYVSVTMYEWPNVSSTRHGFPVGHPKVINEDKGVLALQASEPLLIKDFATLVKAEVSQDIADWTSRGITVVGAKVPTSVIPQFAITEARVTDGTKCRLAGMLQRSVDIMPPAYREPMHIEIDVGSTRVFLKARVVLYATGFEMESRYLDQDQKIYHQHNPPFWQSDSFDNAQAGTSGSVPPKVIIQGAGDGALQDLFRMCVKRDPVRNDPLRAWLHLEERARALAVKDAGQANPEKAAIAFDHALLRSKTAFADRDGYTTGHLAWRRSEEAYRHLDTGVSEIIQAWHDCNSLKYMFKAFKEMRRDDVDEVVLIRLPHDGPHGADWSYFAKCYLLNRVWAWFLFQANAFKLMNGVANGLTDHNAPPFKYSASEVVELHPSAPPIKIGTYTQFFDIVILRVGTQSATEKGQHLGLLPRQITRLDLTRIAPPIRA